MHVANATVLNEADAISADVDGGAGAGLMRIYDDTAAIPTDADASVGSNVLLAEITLNDPSFDAAIDATPGGIINLDVTPVPEDSSANATGTANFARLVDSTGVSVVQFDTVTATGGGGEVEINSISIVSGTAVQITGGSITVPES